MDSVTRKTQSREVGWIGAAFSVFAVLVTLQMLHAPVLMPLHTG